MRFILYIVFYMAFNRGWFLGAWLVSIGAHAQVGIGTGTAIVGSGEINIVSLGNVENRSAQADLSRWNVQLAGANQSLLSTAAVSLNTLAIAGGGVKNLTGTWTVSNLTLTSGLVAPQSGSRLIYRGSEELQGSDNSYISGFLYINRTSPGRHFYPIGTANAYLPATLADVPVNQTLGMTVLGTNAALLKSPTEADIDEFFITRYWKLDVGQGEAPATIIALSSRDTEDFFQAQSAAIVEATAESQTSTNLSSQGSSNTALISSARPISPTSRVFTFARLNSLIEPTIHNAITPNNDGANDYLVIRDIRFYAADNKVTLMDRWGVIVKQWVNFRGFDPITNPPDFDFSQLSTGNYICTMEYQINGERKNVRQMITVIK